RIGVTDDIPSVAREVSTVNDQRSNGAHLRGMLKLISPAAVIGHALAAKELRIVRRWVVHDAENDLPFYIHALIVVPLVLRRGDTITHPDNRCIDGCLRLEL